MSNITPEWYLKILNIERAWKYSQGYGSIVGLLDSDIEHSLSALHISYIANGAKYILSEETNELNQIYVIDQIHRAIEKGCHVFCCTKTFRNLEYGKAWEEVIEKAHNNGMIIVAPTGDRNKRYIDYPAVLEGVISIGSADQFGQRWVFHHWCGSNYGNKIDCIVPGYADKWGLLHGWENIDGGSIACSNMCGIIALLKSVKRDLSFHELQDLIRDFSSLSVIGWNTTQGWGVPDIFRMLANVIPSEVEIEKVTKRLRLIELEIQSIIEELEA
jgi:hypothetical protein